MYNDSDEVENIFEEIPSEIEDKAIDIATYKLITYGADFTLSVLVEKLKDKEIIVPKFQRKHVWPPKMSSKLIESFLLGLPVPQIFLYREEETQELLVVDGQQRLNSVLFFFMEEFSKGTPFYLRSVKAKWEGKKYSDLSEPDKRRLKDSILRATIFQQTDPKDNSSVFEVFERLNTGGMSLKEQEIRNCIIRGRINEYLNSLNEYPPWRYLFGKEEPDSRMRDVELILRFFALNEQLRQYAKPMKEFLTNFMRLKRHISKSEQERYSKTFKETMDFIFEKIGPSAFKVKAGINVAVFDSISVALARVNKKDLSDTEKRYGNLLKKPVFLEAVSEHTTDKDKINQRIKMAIEAFS